MKSKQWQIHKKTNETGNELSESNILSDKYDNLPTIHLTEDLFTGEYDSEFYCCPYFNEKDKDSYQSMLIQSNRFSILNHDLNIF